MYVTFGFVQAASNPIILLSQSGVKGVSPSMHQGFYFTDVWLGA